MDNTRQVTTLEPNDAHDVHSHDTNVIDQSTPPETVTNTGVDFNSIFPFAHGNSNRVLFNHNERFAYQYVGRYGEYNEGEVDVMREFIPSNGLVIEVGASFGFHTLALASIAHAGTILAVEPQRLPFQCLCANLAINSVPNVIARNIGIGLENGSCIVPTYDPFKTIGSMGMSLDPACVQGEHVDIRSIDGFQIPQLDFLMIDVEGMEADVIEGGFNLIDKLRPPIYFEFNWNRNRLLKLMRDLSYVCYRHYPRHARDNNFNNHGVLPEHRSVVSDMVLAVPQEKVSEIETSKALFLAQAGFQKLTG